MDVVTETESEAEVQPSPFIRMENSKANPESVAAAETETEEAEQRSPFRSDILLGQVALITGGGSGIGFEIAKQLGVHGASVVLLGRRLWVLQRAAESLRHQSHNIQVHSLSSSLVFHITLLSVC